MPRVFISYKRADKDKVFPLKEKIETAIGEKCWIDLDGIESSALFENVIINAIDKVEIFLFMYSKWHTQIANLDSDWTVKEIRYADAVGKRIVFINLDQSPLVKWFLFNFSGKQQIDALSPTSFNRLIEDMKKWLDIPERNLDSNYNDSPNEDKENLIESYARGKKLYYSQHYIEALEALSLAAENGHADAQYLSGLINFLGYCGINNYKKAKYWFEKSAEQGHKFGEEHLASMYEHGYGVDRDIEKALYWYTKAAEQQNSDAYFSIGRIYETGDDVEQNDKIAFENYLKVASIGSSGYSSTLKAMLKVAQMYEYGLGIEQSSSQAIKWYKKYLLFLEEDRIPCNDREKEKIRNKIKILEGNNK